MLIAVILPLRAQESSSVDWSDQSKVSGSNSVEKISVTGSRIRQMDVEGPSPIKVIDREEIEKAAYLTVGSILRSSTLSPYGGKSSRVDVRGMGAGRTLVLVNGKRLPRTGGSYGSRATNVNALPAFFVDRIEVLADGASAVYGSEALSSVINIVTRKNWDGVSMRISPSAGSIKGRDYLLGSLAYGKNFSKGYFNTGFDWAYTNGRYDRDRDYVDPTSFKRADYSDNYSTTSTSKTMAFPNCREQTNGRCTQYHGDINRSGDYYRISHFSEFHREIGGGIDLNVDFIGRYTESSRYSPLYMKFSSVNALGSEEVPKFWNLSEKLNYREGDILEFTHRLKGLESQDDSRSYNLGGNISFSGDFAEGDWSWFINNNIGGYRESKTYGNSILIAQSKKVFQEGRYNPFEGTGFSAVADEVLHDASRRSDYLLDILDMSVNGPIIEGSKGSLSLATGLEVSYHEYSERSDPHAVNGNILQLQGASTKGERTHQAIYAELGGIYSRWLESQLAVRWDRYSDFGTTVNPKLALRLNPWKWLALRASTGMGFKAPEISESSGRGSIMAYWRVRDHVTCKKYKGKEDEESKSKSEEYCRTKKYQARLEANPDIKPETSLSWNVGMMVEPSNRFNLKVDYWNYRIENVIGGSRINYFLSLQSKGKNPNMKDFGIVDIIRDKNGDEDDIDEIVMSRVINAGIMVNSGLDVSMKYRINQKSSLNWNYSLMLEDSFATSKDAKFYSVLGNYGVPSYRYRVSWDYAFPGSKHRLRLERTTTGKYNNLNKDGIIPEHSQYNVAYRWNLEPWKKGVLSFKIRNLFNLHPRYDKTEDVYFNTGLYAAESRYSIEYKVQF